METNQQTETQTKNGFAFLRELCSFEADFNAYAPRTNPITNRVQYIIHQLEKFNVPFEIDKFQPIAGTPDAENDKIAFVKAYVRITGINDTLTTMFMAHHDVANVHSENCEDNSASVCNLLDLAIRLSKNKPANNVVIAFVDAEEIVKMPICGAKRTAQKIQSGYFGHINHVFNLELTANGTHYWVSTIGGWRNNNQGNNALNHLQIVCPDISIVHTPYNDSCVLELEGLPSVCIGSLDIQNLEAAKKGFCNTWSVCHSKYDTFESRAVETDMNTFVGFLESLI